MHIEAVRKDASPSRTGLVQDYLKIECPPCCVGITSTTTGWK